MTKPTNTADEAQAEQAAEVEGVRIEQVDPGTLLVDVNVRAETVADKDFIASIKDLGVLQPIRAVRTSEGGLRVEFGHRRTLAAIEAGLATVPVIVVADERTDQAGTVERIVRQYAENEHRTGLTETDKLGVVEQLSLLKVSAAQIAKRTRMKRAHVDQALAVTGSELAKAATGRYDLTLDQAAAIAEFDTDPETVKALVAATTTGQFDHVLARARQDRDDAIQQAELTQQLTEAGVRVIERPAWNDPAKQLGWEVCDTDGTEYMTEAHAGCAGHVAWLETDWVNVGTDGTVYTGDDLDEMAQTDPDRFEALDTHEERRWMPVYGCEDPKTHHARPNLALVGPGDTAASGESDSEAAREAASNERRRVIAGNKAWDAAVTVRRAWLREFFQRKTPPPGAAAFIARAILTGDHALRRALEHTHPLAVDLFGVDGASTKDSDGGRTMYPGYRRAADLTTLTEGASDKRFILITLAIIMAAYENVLDRHSWRRDGGCTEKHYLQYLDTLGYQLSDVERLAAGFHPAETVE